MTAFSSVSGERNQGDADASGRARGAGEGSAPAAPSDELAKAMEEAAASVDGQNVAAGHSAGEAVTEALIAAKKELEGALDQTQKEAAQLRDNWMRAAADLENYRRRAAKEREDVQKFGIERLLKDFLPVVDDLDRAVGVVESAQPDANTEQLLGGVRLVQKKFLSTLEKHGVTTFAAQGQAFDPERHEAVQQAPSDVPAGSVAQELQRGFLIHDRLLRPALVVVSLGQEGGAGGNE